MIDFQFFKTPPVPLPNIKLWLENVITEEDKMIEHIARRVKRYLVM